MPGCTGVDCELGDGEATVVGSGGLAEPPGGTSVAVAKGIKAIVPIQNSTDSASDLATYSTALSCSISSI